jgi:hypothetical protein
MQIDGRCLTREEFTAHVAALSLGPVQTVYIHHTASPTSAWRGLDTLNMLKTWYETKPWADADGREHIGWDAGPHLFVAEDGIWLFTPLTQDGVGVAGHNTAARHIEIVGHYHDHNPAGNTLDNALHAAATLLATARLPIGALRMHRQDQATECPGDYLAANWGWFRGLVNYRLSILTKTNSPKPLFILYDDHTWKEA